MTKRMHPHLRAVRLCRRTAALVVRTGDRVAPGPVTGVKATPRADGVPVSWTASPEDDIDRCTVWTGARQSDGTVKWLSSTSCPEGTSDPLAVLCGDLPDGESHLYAVVARDRWGNALSPSDAWVAVVESTELDVRPAVAVTRDWALGSVGPVTVIGGPDANGPSVNWRCDRTEVCDAVVGYRISRWDAASRCTADSCRSRPALTPTSRLRAGPHTSRRWRRYAPTAPSRANTSGAASSRTVSDRR
ncbi:hypothetical protein SAMN05428944_7799 [Streptomyces sp. 1222.5]|uniref:hypothetical protein n=1 Tax=unclassified Streptomyces TaxID=2593676 RepID=UPI00089AB1E9|nr:MULTISPECIES: hypothetical protein [unclassified Streptomyces]SED47475.1 hypothetical protein SAMN05428944_7799 [Streptomyces sp. 1222.5]